MAITRERIQPESRNLVKMSWDPITRIIGNLGIYTRIDFDAKEVVECKSTSSLFRGYSVFMKGKDPRDAGFITSRICGICGDNHTVCSHYAQQMAYGAKPPELAEWIVNLGEAAEYIFDHTLFQDNLVFVDWCESMVKSTNPSVWARAEQTEAPHADIHGYRTIAEIMSSFEPFKGETYLNALVMSRLTREMFCLMEGRHVHPSTMYPGGVGTVATPQVFTDYLVRLMRCIDFVKKAVAMNDDVFDFWYEALPGYEEVGRRRVLLGCWGAWQDPLGNPVHRDHPWNQTTIPKPQKRDLEGGNYSWVMSPRWYDQRTGEHLALDTGGGPFARLYSAALSNLVDTPYVKARNNTVEMTLPRTPQTPEMTFEWKPPQWSNAIERDRARAYYIAYSAGMALYFVERALHLVRQGKTKTFTNFDVPDEAIGCGFHEAVRGVLSHHLVIRDKKIANYHPYPPTPWNGSPTDSYGTPGPYEDAVQGLPLFEENNRE